MRRSARVLFVATLGCCSTTVAFAPIVSVTTTFGERSPSTLLQLQAAPNSRGDTSGDHHWRVAGGAVALVPMVASLLLASQVSFAAEPSCTYIEGCVDQPLSVPSHTITTTPGKRVVLGVLFWFVGQLVFFVLCFALLRCFVEWAIDADDTNSAQY